MSLAWQTTTEDVENVLVKMGESRTDEEIETIYNRLNFDKIEREALRGDDMLEQIKYAEIEIEEQIKDTGLV